MFMTHNSHLQLIGVVLALFLTSCSDLPVRVIDGDTFVFGEERIRLKGVDTPELRGKCESEKVLALRAKARLQELLSGKFVVTRTGTDQYGRTIASIDVDGRKASEILIQEGLGREWSGRRESWC